MTSVATKPSSIRTVARRRDGGPRRSRLSGLRARRVKMNVAPAGWVLLVVACLVGVAAVKSHAPLLYVLFGVMMAALQASVVMAWSMLRRLELRRKAPQRAWQNRTVPIAYFLRNLRRRSLMALAVSEQGPRGKSVSGGLQLAGGYCAHLPPTAVFRAGARLVASVRGRFELGVVRVTSIFPLGLIRARRDFHQAASLIVWPARGRLKRQLLHRGAVEISSAAPSRGAGGQDEFFGLRDYRTDDNPRWIHWRRSASKANPVVREMARPLPEILYVIVDTQLSSAGDDVAREALERVLRFAATLIDEAFGRGYQVGLALSYSSGAKAMAASAIASNHTALLDALAGVDVNTDRDVSDTLAALRPRQLQQAQVVLVTPRKDLPGRADLRGLRASCRHLLVLSEGQLDAVFEDSVVRGPAREAK